MRQDDRVHFGVRQLEAAAERVAELVVQPDRRIAEDGSAQPCGDQRIAARLDVARLALQARERGGAGADALFGQQVHHRVSVGRVQRLGGMRDRVQHADDGDRERQPERELGVVDDRARQHARVARGLLQSRLGQAIARSHLAAGVGRRHGDDRQARVERERLAEAGRRAAADRDGTVGAEPARFVGRRARGLDRHVHRRLREHAGALRAEQGRDALGERRAARVSRGPERASMPSDASSRGR